MTDESSAEADTRQRVNCSRRRQGNAKAVPEPSPHRGRTILTGRRAGAGYSGVVIRHRSSAAGRPGSSRRRRWPRRTRTTLRRPARSRDRSLATASNQSGGRRESGTAPRRLPPRSRGTKSARHVGRQRSGVRGARSRAAVWCAGNWCAGTRRPHPTRKTYAAAPLSITAKVYRRTWPPVDVHRCGHVTLAVGHPRRSVEDIVGRIMHQHRAAPRRPGLVGEYRRCFGVDPLGESCLALGAIDTGYRRRRSRSRRVPQPRELTRRIASTSVRSSVLRSMCDNGAEAAPGCAATPNRPAHLRTDQEDRCSAIASVTGSRHSAADRAREFHAVTWRRRILRRR